METKEFQFLFVKKINGNTLIQLKDGKILFYHLKFYFNIYIYCGKTFQKLYEINLIDLIKKYENENRKDEKSNEEGEEEEENNFEWLCNLYSNSIKVKEINDYLILIGFNKYLIDLKKNKQTYDCKITNKITDDILELNVLKNKKIIIFTNKKIFVLYKEEKEYIIKDEYLFKDDWKSVTEANPNHYYGEYYEYFSSYILPNNRLILNSFSHGNCHRRCGNAPIERFQASKINFIDLANFEEIYSTKIFNREATYIMVKNNIIIQIGNKFNIYDISSLKLIKEIKLPQIYGNIEKIYDENLIAFSNEEKEKIIIIYTIKNNDLIEKYKVKGNLVFKTKDDKEYNTNELYDYKYLQNLKDNRIIILCDDRMYIIRINDN